MVVCCGDSLLLGSSSRYSSLLVALVVILAMRNASAQLLNECYDRQGQSQRCLPEFRNIALGKRVISNNTCGSPPSKFCVQTGVLEVKKECKICNASDPRLEHPALKITDLEDHANRTWWQSETLLENPDRPVTLTLDLGKSYDVSYIRVRFRSPRPESMAIYKKTTPSSEWVPYQYFSASCEETYRVPSNGIVDPRNQQEAFCTDAFSNISPLTGGEVRFTTLQNRPGAYNFDNSPALQEWVTAVAIRIILRRMNTFGDEVFGDPNVLRSYYYAISDLSVGGRCKCNGHAAGCEEARLDDGSTRLQCRCQHNTEGLDCQRCKPMYNDRPWARASSRDANECVRSCGIKGGRRRRLQTITGGANADHGEWPWQVSIKKTRSSQRHTCGGNVLSRWWILTAAHCVSGSSPANLNVTVGEYRLAQNDGTEQSIPVQRVIRHQNYTSSTIDYDLALLKLSRPLVFNAYVSPVCLPDNDFPDNTVCYSTGWGSTRYRGSPAPNILQEFAVPLQNRNTCGRIYQNTVTLRMRCAGRAMGICSGVGGGPLVCERKGRWFLMGVSSWGSDACDGYPMVYADVLNLKSWILKTIKTL